MNKGLGYAPRDAKRFVLSIRIITNVLIAHESLFLRWQASGALNSPVSYCSTSNPLASGQPPRLHPRWRVINNLISRRQSGKDNDATVGQFLAQSDQLHH